MPVSVSVDTEAQFDTKNGYIPTPTTPRSNPTHRKMAGHVCEMALARAIPACDLPPPFLSPHPPFLPFPTLFSPWDSDGPDPGTSRNFSPFDRWLGNFLVVDDFLIVSYGYL